MLNKSKIEWTDYTINPVKGLCPMGCSYCYARRMYKRFGWNPEITWHPETFINGMPSKPSRIFVGSTIELFGDWVKDAWLNTIFRMTEANPEHTFIFLTKQPQNLIKWSPFPENCIVGISIDGTPRTSFTDFALVRARRKIVSYEPLLAPVTDTLHLLHNLGIDGVIIGQCTPVKKATTPKIEWIKEIVEAADKARIPVFLKDNLKTLLPAHYPFVTNPLRDNEFYLRQEFPNLI